MEILIFSKYFQKIHQIHKPGSRTPGFVQINLNLIQSTIFTPITEQNENVL